MNKIFLILIITSLFSCSDSELNNTNDENLNEPEYLLESITQNFEANDDFPNPYQLIRKYEYDSNNNPKFFYEYYTNNPVLTPILEFIYNNNNELIEIIKRNPDGSLSFKYTFLVYNNLEAEIFAQQYYGSGDLITEGRTINLTFEDRLIKTCEYWLSGGSLYYGVYYQHDTDGRLTNVIRDFGPFSETFEINQWEDNLYPDNISTLNNLLGADVLYLFPKHYNSSKIVTNINNSTYLTENSYLFEYSGNGTIANYTTFNGSIERTYSKNYIPSN